jgi:hypothetical protein
MFFRTFSRAWCDYNLKWASFCIFLGDAAIWYLGWIRSWWDFSSYQTRVGAIETLNDTERTFFIRISHPALWKEWFFLHCPQWPEVLLWDQTVSNWWYLHAIRSKRVHLIQRPDFACSSYHLGFSYLSSLCGD